MISLLRAVGIPARYVSNYLYPKEGEIGESVTGESHAWVEAWDGGWWACDPTNGTEVGERHTAVARGRDYSDVSPLKGIYSGGESEELGVMVSLTRLPKVTGTPGVQMTDTLAHGSRSRSGRDARGVPWIVALIVVATIVVVVLAVLAVRIVSRSDAPPPTPSQPASTTGYSSVADMQSHDPFYVAHRGGSARWPEMSMVAYEKAVELGVGALEVSVARTKDGVYFGLHDKTLDRTSLVSGGIDPSTLTWAQLTSKYQNKLNATDPAGVPYARIDEIFAKFASNHVIFVDPKYIGDAGQRQDLIDQMLAAAPAEHWVLKGLLRQRLADNCGTHRRNRDDGATITAGLGRIRFDCAELGHARP